jgi:flagellar hook-length control protein FliK
VASATPVFAQQLQQVTETTPVAGTAGQAITSSAAITPGNTTLLSARPAESAALQPPLALTEPTAAQQIKDRVMVQIQHKLQTAEVQLHPEELGSMQIKLNLQQDQLSVQFVVQQGAAKEALEQQMPKLRELLEQQGIALSEGQVEQRQSRSQQEQHSGRHGNHAGAESELAAVQTVQMKVSDRMVDFYA